MTVASSPPTFDTGRFFLGLFFIALGIVFLLDRLGYLSIDPQRISQFWPVLLIVFGLSRLLSPDRRCGAGLVALTLGVLFQLDILHLLDFHQSWPILIVAVGAAIAWRALREPSSARLAPRENGHA